MLILQSDSWSVAKDSTVASPTMLEIVSYVVSPTHNPLNQCCEPILLSPTVVIPKGQGMHVSVFCGYKCTIQRKCTHTIELLKTPHTGMRPTLAPYSSISMYMVYSTTCTHKFVLYNNICMYFS